MSDEDWGLDDLPAEDDGGSKDAEQAPANKLHFGSVDEFVRDYLVKAYRRRINGTSCCWDGEWWRSKEAVIRLDAMWRAWEQLRLDPGTGMSVWWRDHADPHMRVLLSEEGPFGGVDNPAYKTKFGDPLPYVAPPEGMFPDVRATDA